MQYTRLELPDRPSLIPSLFFLSLSPSLFLFSIGIAVHVAIWERWHHLTLLSRSSDLSRDDER